MNSFYYKNYIEIKWLQKEIIERLMKEEIDGKFVDIWWSILRDWKEKKHRQIDAIPIDWIINYRSTIKDREKWHDVMVCKENAIKELLEAWEDEVN